MVTYFKLPIKIQNAIQPIYNNTKIYLTIAILIIHNPLEFITFV